MDLFVLLVHKPSVNTPQTKSDSPPTGARLLALLVSLLIAGAILLQLGWAVRDGLSWKVSSERRVLDLSYEANDLSKAKVVGDFALTDRFGKTVNLQQFAGVDILIVNIWSSACPPCIEEMPSLEELDRQLSRSSRAALLTITTDAGWTDVAHIFPRGTDLRILFDPNQSVTKDVFGTTLYPETFILDASRRVRARFDGRRQWHSPLFLDYLSTLE